MRSWPFCVAIDCGQKSLVLSAKAKVNDSHECENHEHSATGADTPNGSDTDLNGHGGDLVYPHRVKRRTSGAIDQQKEFEKFQARDDFAFLKLSTKHLGIASPGMAIKDLCFSSKWYPAIFEIILSNTRLDTNCRKRLRENKKKHEQIGKFRGAIQSPPLKNSPGQSLQIKGYYQSNFWFKRATPCARSINRVTARRTISASMIAITIWMLLLMGAVRGLPRCYPPSTPVRKPAFEDCASVIDMMLEGDKTSAPMHFARDPNRGFRVPHQWINETCGVQIDLVTTDEDTMKLSEIAFAAATIMHICVGRAGQANLGGIEMAGQWQTMKVILGGKKTVPNFLDSELDSPLQLGSQENSSSKITDQKIRRRSG
ncbi:MAG: hypothetical protein Q9216_005868 [Gyalolechia sp. 2 TL-2023]